jgi:O-antigen ligase
MKAPSLSRAAARLPEPRAAMVPAGLIALAAAAGWAVATLPPMLALGLMGGAAAGTLWLLRPDLALYAIILLCPFNMTYRIAGVKDIQPHDLVLIVLLGCAATSLLTESGHTGRFRTGFGRWLLWIWIGLVVWGTITYLLGPANQAILGGWKRDSWCVYRNVLRPLLPFPLLVLLLRDRAAAHRALDVVIAVGAAVALYGFYEAETTGMRPIGPFDTKNGLGGFLILTLPFPAARLMVSRLPMAQRLLYAGIVILTMRVIWSCGSRGAFAALLASLLPLALLIPHRNLMAAAVAGLIGITGLLVVKQDLLTRPRMVRYLTLKDPTEVENFQWRVEQWDKVTDTILERPFLGTGSDISRTLLDEGRLGTAHNSYLGMALRSGIPMMLAWIGLIACLAIAAWRRARSAVDPGSRSLWIGIVTFLAALFVHTNVDNTLLMPQMQYLFWIIASLAVVEAASPAAKPGGAAVAARAREA